MKNLKSNRKKRFMKIQKFSAGDALALWWAYTWRKIVIGIILFFVFALCKYGLTGSFFGLNNLNGYSLVDIINTVITIIISIAIMKIVLDKKYHHFEFKFVKSNTEHDEVVLSLGCNFTRSIRLWWAYVWRCIVTQILYTIVLGIIFLLINYIFVLNGSLGFTLMGGVFCIIWLIGFIVIDILIFRSIVNRNYGKYSLIAVSK